MTKNIAIIFTCSVANKFASKFKTKIADINSIKNDKNIDAVVICSPTNLSY